MKIKNVTNEIALLTLHPNKILRREAQLALVKIEGFKALAIINKMSKCHKVFFGS